MSRGFDTEITQSDSYSIIITVDDNIIGFLVVQKSGSTLKIGLKRGRNYINTTNRAAIKMPAIGGIVLNDSSSASVSGFYSAENLEIVSANASHFSLNDFITTEGLVIRVSNASYIDVKEVKSGEFEIQSSGSSKVTGRMEANSGNIKISGGGTVDLEGEVAYVRLVVTGSGKARLEDLFMQDGDAALSGSGIAIINISGRLDVSASDASHLTYLGNPTLGNIELSDAASVSRQ